MARRPLMSQNRHGTYIYRKVVPQHLRPFLPAPYTGKRELIKSLETKDKRIAEKRMPAVEATFLKVLEQAALAHATQAPNVAADSNDPGHICSATPEEIAVQMAANDAYVEKALAAVIPADDFPTFYRTLGRFGLPVHSFVPFPTPDHEKTTPDATAVSSSGSGASINDVIGKYSLEAKANEQTVEGIRRDWQMLCDVAGLSLASPISAVTRKMVRDFKEILFTHPANTRVKEVMKLPIRERGAYAVKKGVPTLSKGSISLKLGKIQSICAFAANEGIIPENPAQGVSVKVSEEEKSLGKGVAYSADDLKAIFSHPVFAQEPWDHKAWLPILALYTGARLEELAALLLTDVKKDEGVWVLDLSPFDDSGKVVKRIKNYHSRRAIPIHKDVISLGFIQYIRERKAANDRQLFPLLKEVNGERVSEEFSNWWSDQRSVFGITDKRKKFHSFRHLFADLADRAGISLKTAFRLSGHSLNGLGQGGRYGNGLSIPEMAEAVNRIVVPVAVPGLEKEVSA